ACRDLAMAERGEPIPPYDLLALTKGGRQVWLNVSHLVVPFKRSDRFALVHIFRDVSRRKEIEQFVQEFSSSLTKLSESRRSDSSQRLSSDPVKSLTPRELQVLKLMAEGFGTKAIAEKLLISPSTVGNHIQSIFSRLRVHSRLEAVALAFRLRLL
ncbi:MAG: LuxR C-terminal-related transcriptional regulator, partial [Candidatus Methylomirabilales bacterium]